MALVCLLSVMAVPAYAAEDTLLPLQEETAQAIWSGIEETLKSVFEGTGNPETIRSLMKALPRYQAKDLPKAADVGQPWWVFQVGWDGFHNGQLVLLDENRVYLGHGHVYELIFLYNDWFGTPKCIHTGIEYYGGSHCISSKYTGGILGLGFNADNDWDLDGFHFFMPQDNWFKTGFNAAFDFFSPISGHTLIAQTIKFTWGGKDWMLEMWKGTYNNGWGNGFEIEIFEKPIDRWIEHYDDTDPVIMEGKLIGKNGLISGFPQSRVFWLGGAKFMPKDQLTPDAKLRLEGKVTLPDASMTKALYAAAKEQLNPNDFTFSRSGKTFSFVWKAAA
jgi:hypothetical protein